jgi:diphosphomevalonate decarboxylase
MKSTAVANSNIAFVKYWGKRDEILNLPMNPSISMTLDNHVSTKTTVDFSKEYKEDILILNGYKESGEKLTRVSNFLDTVREMASKKISAKVVSINSFPTGSGIASSASGFAALSASASNAIGLKLDMKELSSLARLGSGSAARSIYGGLVFWEDEYAIQIKDEKYWDSLFDIIVVVSDHEKSISSREAMKLTVATSLLYKGRLRIIGERLEKVKEAIGKKDFSSIAKEIMLDSDNLHTCMKDTNPSIVYMNKDSIKIKEIVGFINRNQVKAAYTFDAGANSHIICEKRDVAEIKSFLEKQGYKNLITTKIGKGIEFTKDHLF